ncbi:uncharacterized protein LOC131630707 [Vicia villosa]|uniref:uncharacterized protein LOC131630707 n=1 Tax=Vicia villosa TaxID=3911 RepID=UPI00273B43A4|nr:uncharacterized protein LOC131630707 [Vicia villosa]
MFKTVFLCWSRNGPLKPKWWLFLVCAICFIRFSGPEIIEDSKIKLLNWKTCIGEILSRAKLAGDNTDSCSNNFVLSFSILKSFNVKILPSRLLSTLEVLWQPPPKGCIKVNIDGLARGDPSLIACGGIFQDENACHMGSFCDFLGEGSAALVDLLAAVVALERAKILGWKKIWMESDCSLVIKAFSDCSLVPWKIRSRWLICVEYFRSIDFMIS